MQKRFDNVLNKQGNALQGITVTVKTYPGLALASIYSSNGSGLIGGSYLTTDSQGYYEYYAADGRYTEVVTGPGIETYTVNDISIEDSEADFTALAASSGSSLVGFIQSGTGAVAETLQSAVRNIGKTPKQFGAVGDGSTDDSAAFALWATQITTGGYFWIPPGTYRLNSQVTVSPPTLNRAIIYCYGAVITTAGAISGMKIAGGGYEGGSTWYGLHINHDANTDATAGIDVVGAVNTVLVDPSVAAGGTSAGYAAIRFRNTDTADNGSGAFWGRVINPTVTKRSGANMTYAIQFLGSSGNAAMVRDGKLGSCTNAIAFEIDSGKTYLANGWVVDGVAIEGYTTGILVNGATTSTIVGHRITNNRFENGTTVISYTGTTTQPAVPPFASGNSLASNAGTYLNNPNSLHFNSLDMSITPAIAGHFQASSIKTDLEIISTSGSTFPLTVVPIGGSRGIRVTSGATTKAIDIVWTGTGNRGKIVGNAAGETNYNTARGISGTTTDANNLRGTVTFATAATAAVSFGTAESDTTYFVTVTGNVNETFWVTSIATGGFTINSSNATSTAVVHWHLIR